MKYRSFAAILALVCVLFAQLGVAAHACPMGQGSDDCCVPVDSGEPALCAAHCQQGDESLAQPMAAVALPHMTLERVIVARAAAPHPPPPALPASRPVAVLHCRFLI
jgi:hypothetical protein